MINWKKEKEEKPKYDTDVLMWNDCYKCRKQLAHMHTCLASPANCPNSFQKGRYVKGVDPNDLYAHKYPKEMLRDYWSPFQPSHWAYVTPPDFED